MSDHRASIKIEMDFHGVKDECDMYINYIPEADGVDQRIADFLLDVYWRGMDKYNDQREKEYQRRNKKKIEEKEKAELERLKKKYPSGLSQ